MKRKQVNYDTSAMTLNNKETKQPSAAAAALLSCNDAAFGYDTQPVIQKLSFSVTRGDYLWITGENGSGKSTLVKGLLRLIAPLSGSITFSSALKQNTIGFLSQQNAVKKDFPAGVFEIVLSGKAGVMGLRPFYTRAERQEAEENMKRLDILPLKNRCFRELSGGQQRRVLIARALGASRSLMVLDEPAAGLDPVGTKELYELLKKLNEELGLTIIMVSHDMRGVQSYAARILHLAHAAQDSLVSQQCFFGTTGDYVHSEYGRKFLSAS